MNLGEWLRVILTESLVKRGLSLAAAAISFFKHSVTFLLFALLASAVFVEDLNERQRSRCIFYECVPLVYLSLWGLCIQSKPAFREKRFFFSCPRCQRQGKLWLCLGFWYAFQTGGKTSQPLRLICNGDFFFFIIIIIGASESKTVKGVKRVTSLFSCDDFSKLEVCSVLFLRQFDLVGVRARPLSFSFTHALLKPWARTRHSLVITCQEIIACVNVKENFYYFICMKIFLFLNLVWLQVKKF